MYNGSSVGSVYSSENRKSTTKINKPKTPWNLQHFSKSQTEHSNSSFLAYDFQTLLPRTSPVCLHILHLLRLLSSGNSTDDIPTAAPRGLWGSRGDVAESERVEGLTYTRQTNIAYVEVVLTGGRTDRHCPRVWEQAVPEESAIL